MIQLWFIFFSQTKDTRGHCFLTIEFANLFSKQTIKRRTILLYKRSVKLTSRFVIKKMIISFLFKTTHQASFSQEKSRSLKSQSHDHMIRFWKFIMYETLQIKLTTNEKDYWSLKISTMSNVIKSMTVFYSKSVSRSLLIFLTYLKSKIFDVRSL